MDANRKPQRPKPTDRTARIRTTSDERVPAADFKARCLELLDRVRDERRRIVVTKHGKPVARVVPFEDEPESVVGFLRDSVVSYGDVTSPIDELWEADSDDS
jgi:prevent-host-death family protein